MGSHSSRSSTETSPSIWRRSKPTRAAWWSFVTRCEDIAANHGTPPNSYVGRQASMQVWVVNLVDISGTNKAVTKRGLTSNVFADGIEVDVDLGPDATIRGQVGRG